MDVEIQIQTDQERIRPKKSEDKRIRPESSEVNRLFGDNSLIKSLTGWEPTFLGFEGLKSGIKITAEWFSNPNNLSYYKTNEYII